YDVVTSDGRSPLAWILQGDAALMKNNRLLRRMAYDQESLDPRGASQAEQYQDGQGEQAPLDSDDCVMFIQMLLQKLPPDEADALVAKLAELIQMAHGGVNGDQGLRDNNRQALDKRPRSGHRGAADRRPAMDS